MAEEKNTGAEGVAPSTPGGDPSELRKPALIDLVVAQSGIKKKDAKPVVEATLAVLGQALSEGKSLNLQPFGKLKITRSKDLANGQMLVARVRRSSQALNDTEGLETSVDDG